MTEQLQHRKNLKYIAEEALKSWKLPDQKVCPYVYNFLNENPAIVQELAERFNKSPDEILHFFGG